MIFFEGELKVADFLRAHGFAVSTPCGGTGICGRCAVKAAGALCPAPVDGRVLACQARLLGDAEVWLKPAAGFSNITLSARQDFISVNPMAGDYGLAFDIGTTTIAALLINLKTGEQLATAAMRNTQTQLSDNVIGRINAALNHQAMLLHQLVLDDIRKLRSDVCKKAGISEADIAHTVMAGNTAMLYFLTNRSPKALSAAPFVADHLFGEWVETSYLPRCIGAFLGADLVMALIASGMCDAPDTALLADIGTNGEIALWHKCRLYCAAAAAGPAFEGGGIRMGLGNVPGAIDTVRVSDHVLRVTTIGNKKAVGICGSGLIDAAASFLELGLMDETGRLKGETIYLTDEVYINQEDIRKLQLAKGAVAAAIGALCKTAGIRMADVQRFYLAGGFGAHMRINAAARIGLIPDAFIDRAIPLGNAALTGAANLLLDQGLIDKHLRIAEMANVVTLSGSSLFSGLFMERMLLERY
ncbi:MAG: DUF4445 domain-containing protein [Clostridiales bacterium]|nr:DUF4445 domain-containing protein [Clostridiales bacterium]